MTDSSQQRFETRLIHAGEQRDLFLGSAVPPIFQSTVWETRDDDSYESLRYPRLSNLPNHQVLAAKLASIEGGEAALVTASGMAAISTTLISLLTSGSHLLVQSCVYGGTHSLLREDLPALGIEFDVIDARDPDGWKAKLRSSTRAVYVESISNPLFEVGELAEVARFAREHGLVSVIDNTLASPVNFRPIEWGFDLSLHSATKYLNGHSDIVAGAVVGSEDLVGRVHAKLNHLGGSLDPHACFLLHRGMKTLGLRVRQQNQNALALARFLDQHPAVSRVHYAGLEGHPDHGRASRFFDGFGGSLSFEPVGGAAAARAVIERTTLPIPGPSLGGLETLITRPAATSHSGMPAEERARAGISDGLVRVSVGIEAIEDLVADFGHALEAISAA